MITLFRRVREKFIGEGNVRRYLIYAVGEILLVVIGILIALQVNNWNEEQNKREQEAVILNEIISDLEESEEAILSEIKSDDSNLMGSINSIKIVYDHMKRNAAYEDSLDIHFTNIFIYENVVYKVSGYETLKSYGFDYIQNDDLRKEIGIYFTTTLPQTRQSFEEVRDDFYHYMLEFLRKDFETVFFSDESAERRSYYIPRNYNDLMNNDEFLQSINVFRDIKELYLTNLMTSLEETRNLQLMIGKYLES